MRDKQLIESLAYYAHEAWAGWMHYMFDHCPVKKNDDGSITIPAKLVERWRRQMDTKYPELTEQEKERDRREARKMLKVMDDCAISTNGDFFTHQAYERHIKWYEDKLADKVREWHELKKENERLKAMPVIMPGALTNVVIKHEGADVAQVKALEAVLTGEFEERNRLQTQVSWLRDRCTELERENDWLKLRGDDLDVAVQSALQQSVVVQHVNTNTEREQALEVAVTKLTDEYNKLEVAHQELQHRYGKLERRLKTTLDVLE